MTDLSQSLQLQYQNMKPSKYLKVLIISIDVSRYMKNFDDLVTHITDIFDQLKGLIRREDFVYALNVYSNNERIRPSQRDEVSQKIWEQWLKKWDKGEILIREDGESQLYNETEQEYNDDEDSKFLVRDQQKHSYLNCTEKSFRVIRLLQRVIALLLTFAILKTTIAVDWSTSKFDLSKRCYAREGDFRPAIANLNDKDNCKITLYNNETLYLNSTNCALFQE